MNHHLILGCNASNIIKRRTFHLLIYAVYMTYPLFSLPLYPPSLPLSNINYDSLIHTDNYNVNVFLTFIEIIDDPLSVPTCHPSVNATR